MRRVGKVPAPGCTAAPAHRTLPEPTEEPHERRQTPSSDKRTAILRHVLAATTMDRSLGSADEFHDGHSARRHRLGVGLGLGDPTLDRKTRS